MQQLINKTALVTGASSGIGRAIAKLFAKQGANVLLVARRQKELEQAVKEISEAGGRADFFVGDVSNETTAKEMVEHACQRFGELNITVNNAGTLGPSLPLESLSIEDWNQVISTNMTSAFLAAKYQVPAMQKAGGGSIVFVSSFVGYTIGLPNMAAYSASKAGMIGLAKALSSECAPYNIRVNALLPGGTNTAMGQSATATPEALAFVKNMHALKRLAEPHEIANSALYLASDQSSFTTGTALLVEGGVSVCKT